MSDRKPLVSIITPLFNAEAYIEETIRSVQSQLYKNWEMIIVDDNSSDNGLKKARDFAESDSRIRIFKNDSNLGGSATRNFATDKAKGRFLAFLDADDVWYPEKLDIQVDYMLTNNVGFSFTAYNTMNNVGSELSTVAVPEKVSLRGIYYFNPIGCLTVIYDVSFYGKFYMPILRMKQDYALWIIMLNKFTCAYGLPDKLASYRIHQGTVSSNKLLGVKHYWFVLRDVAGLSKFSSTYFTLSYVYFTLIKRFFPNIYYKMVNNH